MTGNRKHTGMNRIASVYWRNEASLKRFARRFMPNRHDVDDICQETIARALEAERERRIVEPRAFLFGVAKNIVRKRLDRQSRSIIDFIENFSPDRCLNADPPLDEQIDGRERMLLFMEAVATLPDQCQRVFTLRKVYGHSHRDIARELGISISTVEKHVAAGLKRCREHMQRHMDSHGTARRRNGHGAPVVSYRRPNREDRGR